MGRKLGLVVAVVVLLLIGGAAFVVLQRGGAVVGAGGPSPDAGPPVGVAADQTNLPVIYSADFTASPGDEWTVPDVGVTPSGRPFLGPFCNDTVSLRLHTLPTHDLLRVSLDLFIIDTWDGSGRIHAG